MFKLYLCGVHPFVYIQSKVKVHVRQQHIFQLIQDVSKSLFRLRRRRIFSAPRPSDLILFLFIYFLLYLLLFHFIYFLDYYFVYFHFIFLYNYLILCIFWIIVLFCYFIYLYFIIVVYIYILSVLLFFIYNYYFVRYQTCVWKLVDELLLTSENSFNTDQNEFCWVMQSIFKISASVAGEQCWRVGHVVVWW